MLPSALQAVKIKALVFGPSPLSVADPGKIGAIARKRIEIRDAIRNQGDFAEFPEDILAATNPMGSAVSYLLAQEIILIQEHDIVIIIVDSPGSICELGTLAGRTELARKTQTYIDGSYAGGIAYNACQMIRELGGEAHDFVYPADITDCHLLTKVMRLIDRTRLAKFLS